MANVGVVEVNSNGRYLLNTWSDEHPSLHTAVNMFDMGVH